MFTSRQRNYLMTVRLDTFYPAVKAWVLKTYTAEQVGTLLCNLGSTYTAETAEDRFGAMQVLCVYHADVFNIGILMNLSDDQLHDMANRIFEFGSTINKWVDEREVA